MVTKLKDANVVNNSLNLLNDGNLIHWLASRKITNLGINITDEDALNILKLNDISSVNKFIEEKLYEARKYEDNENYGLCKKVL